MVPCLCYINLFKVYLPFVTAHFTRWCLPCVTTDLQCNACLGDLETCRRLPALSTQAPPADYLCVWQWPASLALLCSFPGCLGGTVLLFPGCLPGCCHLTSGKPPGRVHTLHYRKLCDWRALKTPWEQCTATVTKHSPFVSLSAQPCAALYGGRTMMNSIH